MDLSTLIKINIKSPNAEKLIEVDENADIGKVECSWLVIANELLL